MRGFQWYLAASVCVALQLTILGMRRILPVLFLSICCFAEPVSLRVDTSRPVRDIDPKIYGQFLEHIYHSVNGGLWGDLVWNRSFEDRPPQGRWDVEDHALTQRSRAQGARLIFGDPSWRDYEFTVEAEKVGGDEGFLILMRVAGPQDFYWANLGGWGNTRSAIEESHSTGKAWSTSPSVAGTIETHRWYRIK